MRLTAVALALMPGFAFAQETVTDAHCTALWDQAVVMATASGQELTGIVEKTGGNDCLYSMVQVMSDNGSFRTGFAIGAVSLRGPVVPWATGAAVEPLEIDIAVNGIRNVVETGNSAQDFLLRAQGRGAESYLQLLALWDPATKMLDLRRLSLDLPGRNGIEIRALAKNVDLTNLSSAQMSLTGFAVTEAEVVIETHGGFEIWALPMLVAALPPHSADEDFELTFARFHRSVMDGIEALPETSFPSEAREALKTAVFALPNPFGTLRVTMQAPEGWGLARLTRYAMTGMPQSVADLGPLLQGVTFGAEWTTGTHE